MNNVVSINDNKKDKLYFNLDFLLGIIGEYGWSIIEKEGIELASIYLSVSRFF